MQQIHPSQLASSVNVPGVVIVDFFTPYCQPCKQVPPILEAVERSVGAVAYKVDISDDMNHATQLGIRSVPTLIVYKGGQEVSRSVGVPPSVEHVARIVRGAGG